MPKVLEIKGYKFSFYSNENGEPAHIHIKKHYIFLIEKWYEHFR